MNEFWSGFACGMVAMAGVVAAAIIWATRHVPTDPLCGFSDEDERDPQKGAAK